MLPSHSREALKQLLLIIPETEKEKLNLSLSLLSVAAELEPRYTDFSFVLGGSAGRDGKGRKEGRSSWLKSPTRYSHLQKITAAQLEPIARRGCRCVQNSDRLIFPTGNAGWPFLHPTYKNTVRKGEFLIGFYINLLQNRAIYNGCTHNDCYFVSPFAA